MPYALTSNCTALWNRRSALGYDLKCLTPVSQQTLDLFVVLSWYQLTNRLSLFLSLTAFEIHLFIIWLAGWLGLLKCFACQLFRLWLAYNLKPKHGSWRHISNSPQPQKNFVAKVNTLIEFLRPWGLIQANHFIYSNSCSLDGCKIVVEGSLIHSISHD